MTSHDWILVASQFMGPIIGVMFAQALARKTARIDDGEKAMQTVFADLLRFQKDYFHWLSDKTPAKGKRLTSGIVRLEADKLILEFALDLEANRLIELIDEITDYVAADEENLLPEDPDEVTKRFTATTREIIKELRRLRTNARADDFSE